MRLICPSCGAMHSAEAWANDADARKSLEVVADFKPGVGKLALPYLALFRQVGSGRALIWSKALRLLSELRDFVSGNEIHWDRCPSRPAGPSVWAEALEQLISRPPKQLPLTTHGYLRKIAYDIADRMDKAVEVRRNQAERSGKNPCRREESGYGERPWFPSPEDIAQQKALLNKIGRKI